ncbi:cytochrome P450 [Ophiocordyceps camponoti-floridani]|uniref:Cytochrome P450 n=1 Tax=Ophiocordyceps camponoti-floridani TaxID=2030778 RepID=A0A8H4Q8U2_9HYPO|nr:cytochrome P450 [Ophiocordyceps camponoti-floridani]
MWLAVVLKYAFVGLVLPWSIAFVVYRLAFHPLRKYPGPFWAKFTDSHSGLHAIGKRPHLDTYVNLRRYGVYRPAPNRLVFNSLTAVRDIYHNPNVTKARAYRHSRWLDRPNLFDTPDKDEHRRKRRVIGQVVSDRSLRVFEPIMSAQIDIFLSRLQVAARDGEVVNVTELCRRLAVDVVGHLAFGYPLRTQTETTNRFIPEAMGKAIYMTNLYYTWPALGIVQPLLRWLARKKVFTFQQAVRKMILARMAEPREAKPDFYGLASGELNAMGDQLDDSELWNEALFFVTAGGTTVSTAMCGLFFNLSQHPDIYARVAAEVRSAFSSGREIHNGPRLAGCRYLRAVIDESLRLSPPSLSPLWREPDASSTEPWVVDGHVIPPGTEAAVHLYSILHHPEYFPDPFAFKPERWLEEDEGGAAGTEAQEARATARRAQVSFGMGERSCAGKAMAYMETSVTMARTLWYFDFHRAPGEAGTLGAGMAGEKEPWAGPTQYQLQDILVADHDGPNMVFTPRGEFWRERES